MNKNNIKGAMTRAKILNFLRGKTEAYASVTYREIAKEIGVLSTNTVEHHLRILETEGKIELVGIRTIKILTEDKQ